MDDARQVIYKTIEKGKILFIEKAWKR